MLATGSVAIAQQKSREAWVSPFDFPLLLSANFGELRPNHFHNGIDIKTQGVTGSRYTVWPKGIFRGWPYSMEDTDR